MASMLHRLWRRQISSWYFLHDITKLLILGVVISGRVLPCMPALYIITSRSFFVRYDDKLICSHIGDRLIKWNISFRLLKEITIWNAWAMLLIISIISPYAAYVSKSVLSIVDRHQWTSSLYLDYYFSYCIDILASAIIVIRSGRLLSISNNRLRVEKSIWRVKFAFQTRGSFIVIIIAAGDTAS